FIAEYCDRWCERCPYTARCSAFACRAAYGMCGNYDEALKLAVGPPRPVGEALPERNGREELESVRMSPDEEAAFEREEAERRQRISRLPLKMMSGEYSDLSYRWLTVNFESVRARVDTIVREALEVVAHDSVFIGPKLGRALDGRDRYYHGEDLEEDPIQSDWNGSAKVAIISIERSEAAWRLIADVTGD